MCLKTHHFIIADFNIEISFAADGNNDLRLLPSMAPFKVESPDSEKLKLFALTVDDKLRPRPKEERERIRVFDTGNGDTIVDRLSDGGYQYIIKDIHAHECCLLITNKDFTECHCALNGNYNMRSFGLNNALMLIFAFAGSHHQTLLIHASLVRQNGYGYAFIAKSGTGKSTQVSSWLRYIPGCDLMNDDNPIVRLVEGNVNIYGSPWSGKTPCYRKVRARLGAVTRIDRAKTNSIERLGPLEAFASFLPSCSSMKWDSDIYDHICDTVGQVVERIGIYTLHCLPDREAAEICHDCITRHKDNTNAQDRNERD